MRSTKSSSNTEKEKTEHPWSNCAILIGLLLVLIPMHGSGLVSMAAHINGWSRCWGVSTVLAMVLLMGMFALQVTGYSRRAQAIETSSEILSVPLFFAGVTAGELWRASTWPFFSLVAIFSLVLVTLETSGVYLLTKTQIRRRGWETDMLVIGTAGVVVWAATGTIAAAVIVVELALSFHIGEFAGYAGRRIRVIQDGYALAAGLLVSAYLITAWGDFKERVIYLGVDDSAVVAPAIMAAGVAVAMTGLAAAYIFWALRTAFLKSLDSKRALAPERTEALFCAMGLGVSDARVALMLIAGENGGQICSELALSLGALNTSRRRIYATFKVHSSVQLKKKIEAILTLT